MRRSVLVDGREKRDWLELWKQHHIGPLHRTAERVDVQSVDMVERQHANHCASLAQVKQALVLNELPDVCNHIVVCQRDALR